MLSSCPYYDLPQQEPEEEGFFPRFSMCSGDFVEIYGSSIPDYIHPLDTKQCHDCTDVSTIKEVEKVEKGENEEQWEAVVTCFFVDTAPVVLGE